MFNSASFEDLNNANPSTVDLNFEDYTTNPALAPMAFNSSGLETSHASGTNAADPMSFQNAMRMNPMPSQTDEDTARKRELEDSLKFTRDLEVAGILEIVNRRVRTEVESRRKAEHDAEVKSLRAELEKCRIREERSQIHFEFLHEYIGKKHDELARTLIQKGKS